MIGDDATINIHDHTSFLAKAAPETGAVTFSLSMPPSVNHCYIGIATGARILSKEARAWIEEASWVARTAAKAQRWKKTNGKWLICELTFYMKDKRKRDTHNYFKVLFDALEGILYDNDYYVMPRVMGVAIDRDNPRIELSLREA